LQNGFFTMPHYPTPLLLMKEGSSYAGFMTVEALRDRWNEVRRIVRILFELVAVLECTCVGLS
jgi:hypothetical protein